MKRVLVVHGEGEASHEVRSVISQRADGLESDEASSIDVARRLVKNQHFDAVILGAGLKQLSLASFLKLLTPKQRVLFIDDTSPARVVDQLFAALELPRSVSFDEKVIDDLGFAGNVAFAQVEWNGATLLRAQISRRDVDPTALASAQQAGQLSGPGLAQTVEIFWDDPRPHVLQHAAPGVSLDRLVKQRSSWGAPFALALGRGIADGVVTLHEAGFSAGTLRAPSIWLTEDGEVLLLGHGLTQLPFTRLTYYGLPSEAPPEEYGTALPPKIPGDAFRLGVLLAQVATNVSPVTHLNPVDYLRREWQPRVDVSLTALEPFLHGDSVDRPRGELLRTVLEAAAPADRRELIRDAVKWSRATPALRW